MSNGLRTRENMAGMDANHPTLPAYRAAVEHLKNLPQTDPRNWVRHEKRTSRRLYFHLSPYSGKP
jgi:hypothetical protein